MPVARAIIHGAIRFPSTTPIAEPISTPVTAALRVAASPTIVRRRIGWPRMVVIRPPDHRWVQARTRPQVAVVSHPRSG